MVKRPTRLAGIAACELQCLGDAAGRRGVVARLQYSRLGDLSRRAFVSSWMKIWIVAASGTAVSARVGISSCKCLRSFSLSERGVVELAGEPNQERLISNRLSRQPAGGVRQSARIGRVRMGDAR
jgi:hypothetical protein